MLSRCRITPGISGGGKENMKEDYKRPMTMREIMDSEDGGSRPFDAIVSGFYYWFGVGAGFWGFSAIMYVINNSDKWFSRAMASLACQGIVTIIYMLKNR